MNKTNYSIVLTTFESQNQAKPIIDCILSSKLAACVQTINIGSHYVWKNEVCHEKEILVLFKTTDEKYEQLKSYLEGSHPYETPEIIKISIEDGLKAYFSWIDDSTK